MKPFIPSDIIDQLKKIKKHVKKAKKRNEKLVKNMRK
jgi:rRNA-processing protein FCF1